jgi:SAM-dependent methyltransferase
LGGRRVGGVFLPMWSCVVYSSCSCCCCCCVGFSLSAPPPFPPQHTHKHTKNTQVRNPAKALHEIHRVLRPGGKFVFIEHIFAQEGTFLRAQQAALDPLQQLLAGGCHLTRETDRLFVAAAASGEGGEGEGGGGGGEGKGGGSGGGGRPPFSRVERLDYLEQSSKWPIVRQVAGVLVK